MNESGEDLKGLEIALNGLSVSDRGGVWTLRVQRPRDVGDVLRDLTGTDAVVLKPAADGTLALPTGTWNQIELTR